MYFPPQNFLGSTEYLPGRVELKRGATEVGTSRGLHHPPRNREDQRAMKEEQQRQGRDIEEIKHYIRSSRRSTSRHH